MGQEERANLLGYPAVIRHLPDDISVRDSHRNLVITDVSVCLYHSRFYVGFLTPSQK